MTVVTRTILYVDDEPALCRAFERALRGPGVRIVTTTSAPHAVELLDSERFDVVATDYRMPELNGIEILRAARTRAPGARRLLVSGRVDGEVNNDVLADADVDGVVIKPWSLDELRRVVRRAAELAALTRERAQLLEASAEQLRALDEVRAQRRGRELGLLLSALEVRDAQTAAHARRVARVARVLAEKLGLGGEELSVVEDGALVHDVGKLGLSDELLRKDENLAPEEWAALRDHPLVGARLLDGLDVLPGTVAVLRQHHERVNGEGYPLGLKGQEITLAARIVAVVDAYDAMRSDRGWRAARGGDEAAAELLRCAGTPLRRPGRRELPRARHRADRGVARRRRGHSSPGSGTHNVKVPPGPVRVSASTRSGVSQPWHRASTSTPGTPAPSGSRSSPRSGTASGSATGASGGAPPVITPWPRARLAAAGGSTTRS